MLLYVCTLFSALTFGFHQSQMTGQQLGSVDELFCGNPIPGFTLDDGQTRDSSADFKPSCPMCSSLGQGITLTSMGWSPDPLLANTGAPRIRQHRDKPAPRFVWSALNPRAPPVATPATGLPSRQHNG